jgi:hypothetical protein
MLPSQSPGPAPMNHRRRSASLLMTMCEPLHGRFMQPALSVCHRVAAGLLCLLRICLLNKILYRRLVSTIEPPYARRSGIHCRSLSTPAFTTPVSVWLCAAPLKGARAAWPGGLERPSLLARGLHGSQSLTGRPAGGRVSPRGSCQRLRGARGGGVTSL